MAVTDRKPTGLLKAFLRAPIVLYRAGFGRVLGHRLVYIAHRGRRSGARREVVVETIRYDPRTPEIVVIAAWGPAPDWYLNLRAAPAIEVRIGAQRWAEPAHRYPDGAEVRRVLRDYQTAHPRAWGRLAPLLGFPVDLDDRRWAEVEESVTAIAFTPSG